MNYCVILVGDPAAYVVGRDLGRAAVDDTDESLMARTLQKASVMSF